MSYQVNWEIQALDQAAGFLRDDPIGFSWRMTGRQAWIVIGVVVLADP